MVSDLLNRHVGLIGANGFIGSAILQALVRSGITPRALWGPTVGPGPVLHEIGVQTCDLTDAESLRSWITGLDVVIHAAGPPSVQRSFEIPQEYVRVHGQGTATVLHVCHEAKVDRLIYISSAEVYGRPEVNPVSENHRLQARSPYAAAKIGAEKMIEAYVESFGMKAIILRPFSIYGPNPIPESLLGSIITMSHGSSIRLRDLRPVRDYCYVGDLATAVLHAIRRVPDKLEVFNVGTGKGTNVGDFAALALRSMGKSLPVVESHSYARPGRSEIFELVADISMARDAMGWRPDTGLEEGLRLTLSHGPGKV